MHDLSEADLPCEHLTVDAGVDMAEAVEGERGIVRDAALQLSLDLAVDDHGLVEVRRPFEDVIMSCPGLIPSKEVALISVVLHELVELSQYIASVLRVAFLLSSLELICDFHLRQTQSRCPSEASSSLQLPEPGQLLQLQVQLIFHRVVAEVKAQQVFAQHDSESEDGRQATS